MITGENIEIQSRFAIYALADMQMEVQEGCHGKLVLRAFLSGSGEAGNHAEDQIKVINREKDTGWQEVLFCGIIRKAHVYMENGVSQVILLAETADCRMDEEVSDRSFQDTSMTYDHIMKKILSKYHGTSHFESEPVKTGLPVVQYRETDWQFINRLAGYMGLGLYCDESAEEPAITVGMPGNGKKADFGDSSYQVKVDEGYYHGWKGEASKKEFLHYQVESDRNYSIGDHAYYKGQKRYIFWKQAEWQNGTMVFRYKLGGRIRFQGRKEYNSKLAGAALAGTITKTEKETAYIKLDIDGKDGVAAYPYPFRSISGNILYSMPQAGTRAYLYFPDQCEEKAFIGNCMPDGTGGGFPQSPQDRMIGTEHGKQLLLYADRLALQGGKEDGRQMVAMQGEGYLLNAGKGKLSMTAAGRIVFRAPDIILCTPLEIRQLKSAYYASGRDGGLKKKGGRNPSTGGDASFVMQHEFNGMSSQGVLQGTQYEEYVPFDDAPEYENVYPTWLKVVAGTAVALLVGVAVGVLVLCAAPAVVTVAGLAITGMQIAVAAGALTAAVGTLAAAHTAEEDDGTTSIGEYISNSFKASAAVGGAIAIAFMAPYAAESMVNMAVPAGTSIIPMFGHYIPSVFVSKAIELGVAGAAGMKLFFGFSEVGLFLDGRKELGAKTGNELYDGMKEWSDILAIEIILWGASNPRFWENVDNRLFPQSAGGTVEQRLGSGSSTARPTWRQSEKDVGDLNPDYKPQQSFLNGEKVPYGTSGSSRPDWYKPGSSIEVKNYDVTSSSGRTSLINVVSTQVNKRITDLPDGTIQTIIIDIRGQQVTNDVLRQIRDAILEKCNIDVIIQFMR